MIDLPSVNVGDVFVCVDRQDPGRTVRVVEIERSGRHGPFARCEDLDRPDTYYRLPVLLLQGARWEKRGQ